jgi:hypothetical protein
VGLAKIHELPLTSGLRIGRLWLPTAHKIFLVRVEYAMIVITSTFL